MKKVILLSGIIASLCFPNLISKAKAQENQPALNTQKIWNARETFEYDVRYGFFDLGKITLYFKKDTVYKGQTYRLAHVVARSNPGLPFVGNKEDHFTSIIARNDTMLYDTYYWKDDIDEHVMRKDVYILNYQEGKVYTFKKGVAKDTLSLSKPSMCGIAYFFFTRIYAGTGTTETVPVYINQKKSSITLVSSTKTDKISNDAFPGGKVNTFISTGEAHFDGPFGFKGNYKAWYSTGSMRIPVQAYVRVWLGNVKIRLIKYSTSN